MTLDGLGSVMRSWRALVVAVLLAGCASPGPGAAPQPEPGVERIVADPPTVVAANPTRDRETDVAFDPLDAAHVAILYGERPEPQLVGGLAEPMRPGTITLALAASRDGGASWAREPLPMTGTAAPTSRWSAFCAMGDPNAFFDAAGALHMVALALSCGGPAFATAEALVHAVTEDDGKTWTEPDVVWAGAGGVAGSLIDRQWAALEPGGERIGVAWTTFDAGFNRATLHASFSTDGGRTWSAPRELDSVYPNTRVKNYNVHAFWTEGLFHVSAHGCEDDGVPFPEKGLCVLHFAGGPDDASFARTELPLAACDGLAEGRVDYPVTVAAGPRLVLAAGVRDPEGRPLGVCVFGSDDAGATWREDAAAHVGWDHPWLAPAPGGRVALAYLAVDGAEATPRLALLDAAALDVLAEAPLGPAYDADTDGDGLFEYGDYDVLAAAADGAFVWGLTQPNPEGPTAPEGNKDLDVVAYRGRLTTSVS